MRCTLGLDIRQRYSCLVSPFLGDEKAKDRERFVFFDISREWAFTFLVQWGKGKR